jgi:hypothetical protein
MIIKTLNIVAGSGTISINVDDYPYVYFLKTSGSITLSANLVLSASGTPVEGQTIEFLLPGNITLSSYTFTIFGITIDSTQALKRGSIKLIWNSTTGAWFRVLSPDWTETTVVGGNKILDNSLALSKISGVGANEIVAANNSGVLGSVAIGSQRIPINNGTTIVGAEEASGSDISWTASSDQLDLQIKADVIVDANINSAAAIDRSKLANGTANHVVINSGGGAFSSEAQLAQSRGGTGIDTSSSTGFPTINSGTWSVNALTCTQRVDVSFDANRKGAYYVNFPFACTVTNVKIRATDLIEATDNGTINFKNDSGTNMVGSGLSSGNITITGGSVIGDGFTSTLTSNNTFTANQEMRITTSKTTSGGNCSIDITYTRFS